MARYSIDGQILTDIGDAIRSHTSETRIDVGNWEIDIVKDNLDADGNYTSDGCFDKYSIPGAKRIVISNIEHTASNTSGGYVSISSNPAHTYAGLLYYSLNPKPGVQLYSGNSCPKEIILEDTEYFAYLVKSNIASGLFTFSAHVVAYDENGEILATREYETKNTFTPDQMADEINDLLIIPDEALNITGSGQSRFANGYLDWFIEAAGHKITTKDIHSIQDMFYSSGVEYIPFTINLMADTTLSCSSIFNACRNLKEIPTITGKPKVNNLGGIFNNCYSLRDLPEDIEDWFDWSLFDNATSTSPYYGTGIFGNCQSLRSIPMGFLSHENPRTNYNFYSMYNGLFSGCLVLDEIIGLPINRPSEMALSSNYFSYTFNNCSRLKNMTFATNEDGSPIQVNWKNQIIDLSNYAGYTYSSNNILNYNSGITADKEVKDDATYQALKNDPDWFACKIEYSRYNHDGAVATINSLPDTTISGGTNTIQFKGNAGSATDGGAINTLTAEEIAVATAKGWTITLS